MDRTEAVEGAGEILKSLNPTAIGVLLFVIDDIIDKQVEMAEKLDCTSAPVSLSLQSMSELSTPLVRRNRQYHITQIGRTTITRVDQMMLELDIDLCDVDWSSDDDKAEVGSALQPLHNSRSMMPFYVLDSISGQIDIDNTSSSTTVDDILSDVRELKAEKGEGATRRQIKHAIDRFEEAECVAVDANIITIKTKGIEQARLFDQLVDFLTDGRESSTSTTDQKGGKGATLQFPAQITVGELSDRVQQLEDRYGRDEVLEVRWSLSQKVKAPNEN